MIWRVAFSNLRASTTCREGFFNPARTYCGASPLLNRAFQAHTGFWLQTRMPRSKSVLRSVWRPNMGYRMAHARQPRWLRSLLLEHSRFTAGNSMFAWDSNSGARRPNSSPSPSLDHKQLERSRAQI